MLIACLNRLSLREHANLELGITRKAAHEGGPSSSTVVGFAAHEHSVG